MIPPTEAATPAPPMEAPLPAPEPMGSSREVCLPIDSLTMDDQGGKPASPEVGDPVDFTATGTVSSLDGDKAYITLESVNGEPLGPDDSAPGDATEGDLQDMAAEVDNQPENY